MTTDTLPSEPKPTPPTADTRCISCGGPVVKTHSGRYEARPDTLSTIQGDVRHCHDSNDQIYCYGRAIVRLFMGCEQCARPRFFVED